MNRIVILLVSALLLAGSAVAQESAPREKVRRLTITQDEPMIAMQGGPANMMFQHERLAGGEISFFSAEMAGAGETITAAPYTATATTESTQVLADGNRIVNKTSSFVARDSQGRTRRETDLHRIEVVEDGTVLRAVVVLVAEGQLGVAHLADRDPRDLSSGERQRAAIAAVLAGAPDIALLDEPTRGMDEAAREALCRVVMTMRAAGSAIVVATHDRQLVSALADRTVAVGAGTARELITVAVA